MLAGSTAVLVHNCGDTPAPSMGPHQNVSLGSTATRTDLAPWELGAMKAVQANPQGVVLSRVRMTDPRWHSDKGWVKMSQEIDDVEIHYVRNTYTGEVDDFKVKDGMDN